jgi:hypothetical protein
MESAVLGLFLGAGTECGARRPADVVMLYADMIGLAVIAPSDENCAERH